MAAAGSLGVVGCSLSVVVLVGVLDPAEPHPRGVCGSATRGAGGATPCENGSHFWLGCFTWNIWGERVFVCCVTKLSHNCYVFDIDLRLKN